MNEYNTIVNNENNAEFKNIPRGNYKITVNDEDYEDYSKNITITKKTTNPYEENITLTKKITPNNITSNIDYTDIWYPTLTSTVLDKSNNPISNQDITITTGGENPPLILKTDSNGQINTKIRETEPTTITLNTENITRTINFTPKTRTIEYDYLVNDGDGRTCAYFIDKDNQNQYVGYNNNNDPAFLLNTTTNQEYRASDLSYTLPYNKRTPFKIIYNAKEIIYKYTARTGLKNELTLSVENQDMSNYRLAYKAVRTVKLYNFKVNGEISTEAQNPGNWSRSISTETDNNETYISISGMNHCILNILH